MHYPCSTAQCPSSFQAAAAVHTNSLPAPSMAPAAASRGKCLYSGPLPCTDGSSTLHCCWWRMWFIAVPSDITNVLLYKSEIILNSPSLLPALVHHMLRDTAFWVNNEVQQNKVKEVMIKLNICCGIFLLNRKISNYCCYQGRNVFFPGYIPDTL